jgi:hypothetical protein
MPPPAISRRAVLKGLAGGGAAMLAGSLPLAGCRRPAPVPDFKLAFLSPEEFRTVQRLADLLTPGDDLSPPARDLGVARQADALLATLDPLVQEQFQQLLGLFEGVPLLALRAARFSDQSDSGAAGYLGAWARSCIPQMRQGFAGLKRLATGIYYADPRTWPALGYDGVWIGERDRGAGRDSQSWDTLVNPHVYEKFQA